MPKRDFDEMVVEATGVQSFVDRFGKRRRFEYDTPPISQWRCNLTGLSQVHNLYFVAYGQDVYVYTPQFPTQAIGERPTLIFTSQPSRPQLTGYLDQRSPHCINGLIVQLLGKEEVIAVVRDDGDVDAFLVRHVVHAIERRAEPDSAIGAVADEIKPFFQSNVGISAWGLAIHSEARILATSSNAHEVRIFKFGLLDSEDDQASDDEEELPDADPPKHRKTDVTHHVLNGETNIPYIAFCNTGDDPNARWLLTTDISGVCRVMDLHALQPVQAFRFGRSFASTQTWTLGGYDRINAGWSIMFLDRRSFQAHDSVQSALGMQEGEKLPGIQRNSHIWDLSRTAKHLSESSEPFVYHRSKRRERKNDSSPKGAREDETMRSSSAESREESSQSESGDGGGSAEVEVNMPDEEVDMQDDDDEEEDYEEEDGGIELDPSDLMPQEGSEDLANETRNDAQPDEGMPSLSIQGESESEFESPPALIDDGADPDDEGTEDTVSYTSFYNGDSLCGNSPRFVNTTCSLADDLPCPILHASVRNIYLLQPTNHEEKLFSAADGQPMRSCFPMLGFANPLRQTIQQDFEYLRVFERLNLNACIPQLGIVVLASQKGRAIVLSLTKIPKTASYPPEMTSVHEPKTSYAMRVLCILPFAHQEKENQRPFAPLHGIAVGPLQGQGGEGPTRGQRYRLMMMYQDHSILSYEIGRTSNDGARDSGIAVEKLVV